MYHWLEPSRPGWGDSSILGDAYPCRCCGVPGLTGMVHLNSGRPRSAIFATTRELAVLLHYFSAGSCFVKCITR